MQCYKETQQTMDFLMSVRHKFKRDTVKWGNGRCGRRTTNGGRQKNNK